jgi:hypothetical protein
MALVQSPGCHDWNVLNSEFALKNLDCPQAARQHGGINLANFVSGRPEQFGSLYRLPYTPLGQVTVCPTSEAVTSVEFALPMSQQCKFMQFDTFLPCDPSPSDSPPDSEIGALPRGESGELASLAFAETDQSTLDIIEQDVADEISATPRLKSTSSGAPARFTRGLCAPWATRCLALCACCSH